MRTPLLRATLAILVAGTAPGCVSGNKIRADADVIRNDIERARRSGAYRCAPKELATAEANLDFALGELSQGSSFRAAEHARTADQAAKKAVALSRDCGPKQVLVKEKPVDKPLVVRIEETDRDGDGIPDHTDQCPDEPEDPDGFQDEDGCPDPDNDGDGVPDVQDRCPTTPGPKSNQGCPAEDRDGDGIPDHLDRCPDDPEDKDGFQDEDGCPDPDNDGDGLVDGVDKCPNEPGPIENQGCPIRDTDGDGLPDHKDTCPKEAGPVENQGCPDADRDRDGIVDRLDKCPDEFGVAERQGCPDPDRDGDGIVDRLDKCPDEFGVAEEQGCPKKYKTVVIKKDRIEISQQIKFKTGSHQIIGRDSEQVLDDVAAALNDNPRIRKVRIEGHTDSVGNDAANLRLSQRRADAVMAALIKRKVDPGRLEAVGFGEANPIASNNSASGRAENRRTEFNIVEQ
jgi:OOP family OmpA-OmpF porin